MNAKDQSKGGRDAVTLRSVAKKDAWTDHSFSVRGRRSDSQNALVAIYQAKILELSMHISNKCLKQIHVMTDYQLALG